MTNEKSIEELNIIQEKYAQHKESEDALKKSIHRFLKKNPHISMCKIWVYFKHKKYHVIIYKEGEADDE